MKRNIFALIIGLAGALFLWLISPWNDFVIRASFLCDSYVPVGACAILILIVLGLNPLLRAKAPSFALGHRQLLVVMGILFVASALPGTGLLRQLPYSVAYVPYQASHDLRYADALNEAEMRPELFPEPIEFDNDVPASEHFLTMLPEGEGIPWAKWLKPTLAWGSLMVFMWLMIIGMAQIVVPQWRDNERLAFPLLKILDPLLADPDPGHRVAAIFKSRAFWLGTGLVLWLHLANGYHERFPGALPAIPLMWDIRGAFTEGMLRHMPWCIKTARIYVMFMGVAFFMPLRISFSIWMFPFIYAVWRMIESEYYPPYYAAAVTEHRMGAMIMMAAIVVWLGRIHFRWVFSRLWVREKDPDSIAARRSAVMFILGTLGICAWFCWARVPLGWAIALTLFGMIVTIMIARMVAETGMPFLRMQFGYDIAIMKLAPAGWFTVPVLFFIRVVASLFSTASRMAVSVLSTHAMAADKEADAPQRWRLGLLLLLVLMMGFLICGASHLNMTYHNESSRDESFETPINSWGTRRFAMAANDIKEFASHGQIQQPPHSRGKALMFGAGFAAVLEVACLRMPAWPLHPIGLLMVDSYYANAAWPSIFLGWLCALLILKYGGSKTYRLAALFFIGVIVGDVLAGVYWSLESVIMAWLEYPYKVIWIQPS